MRMTIWVFLKLFFFLPRWVITGETGTHGWSVAGRCGSQSGAPAQVLSLYNSLVLLTTIHLTQEALFWVWILHCFQILTADLHLSEHQFRVEHLASWSDYYTVSLLKLNEFEKPMSIKGPDTEGRHLCRSYTNTLQGMRKRPGQGDNFLFASPPRAIYWGQNCLSSLEGIWQKACVCFFRALVFPPHPCFDISLWQRNRLAWPMSK